jgi:hypothetical protein
MSSANYPKLQHVQNTLAHVVLRQGKHDHVTPALVQFHWLHIRQRITFDIALHSLLKFYILISLHVCMNLLIIMCISVI